jgi:GDP-L-fucose synthase
LLDQTAVFNFYKNENPEYVINSAARVGWIKANMTFPADFLYENLQIQNNIIWGAHTSWVPNLLFLWSSCIYPRGCPQPMKEEYLLDWKPEPTNEWYSLAKIVGIKLCEKIKTQYHKNYISCMPTNIYGLWDNFDPESSHVIPGLMGRIHEAKVNNTPEVVIWGSWESKREFLYVDDLAEACIFLLQKNINSEDFLNIWTGIDVSIKDLAYTLKKMIWYSWNLVFDTSKPDGMPRKLLDVSKIEKLWWKHSVDLTQWLKQTYEWFQRI